MNTSNRRPQWVQPPFSGELNPSNGDRSSIKSGTNKLILPAVITTLTLAVGGLIYNASLQSPDTPIATSSPTPTTPSVLPTPTPQITVTAESPSPTPTQTTPEETPSTGVTSTATVTLPPLPPLGSLKGKVGYAPHDPSSGVLWGRAVTSSATNMLPLVCKDGTPYVQLNVVGSNGMLDHSYDTYGYPEAQITPCSGDRVVSDVADNPSKYYTVLLAAALVNR